MRFTDGRLLQGSHQYCIQYRNSGRSQLQYILYGFNAHLYLTFHLGLTPTYFKIFTWGKTTRYEFDKAIQHISNWKKLQNESLTEGEIRTLEHIFEQL